MTGKKKCTNIWEQFTVVYIKIASNYLIKDKQFLNYVEDLTTTGIPLVVAVKYASQSR